jgi:hypothetical protein
MKKGKKGKKGKKKKGPKKEGDETEAVDDEFGQEQMMDSENMDLRKLKATGEQDVQAEGGEKQNEQGNNLSKDDDEMVLEEAPKSELKVEVDDKSDPGIIEKLKEEEANKSGKSPKFMRGGITGKHKKN